MRSSLVVLPALALLAFTLANCHSKKEASGIAGPLDGTHWTIKVTPDDAAMRAGEKTFDDTLDFAAGRVSMSECLKQGFAASPYTAAKTSDGYSFKTVQTSAGQGRSAWQGETHGNSVTGTMTWTKEDG